MKPMFSVTAAAATLFAAAPATASREDQAINAVYAGLAAARAVNSAEAMAAAFAPEALLIDARPGGATSGAELGERLAGMAARLRQDGITVATGYRIERRSLAGDIAIDSGYMRQAVSRPGGGAQPVSGYFKFLVTLRRGADGRWRIVADASMPSTEEAWNAVRRTERLHHDA